MRHSDPDDRYARLRASVATLYPHLDWQELAAGTLGLMRTIESRRARSGPSAVRARSTPLVGG